MIETHSAANATEIATGDVAVTSGTPVPEIVIAPASRWSPLRLDELWRYRELLYFFVWRDIKVRYKQTVLGAAWAVVQPLTTMILFTVVFGRLANLPRDGIPGPVFYYAALVPWTYFSTALSSATASLVGNQNLIAKTYFPRLILPLSSVVTPLVDFAIAMVVLALLMIGFRVAPTSNIILMPALLLVAVLTALGAGLWLCALNVRFRDVRHVMPFMVQLWMFASPIAYPMSMIPERWRPLYALNPMAGVIETFRWMLTGKGVAPGLELVISLGVVATVFLSGAFYFRKAESDFADVI